ncbi:MAG: S1 RNA-binding domain-containing protein [Clostridiales Family XIII bacterium]|nr:S1 RNA-binding domain-containing protein [Clostridiales Family XIII bacterium]
MLRCASVGEDEIARGGVSDIEKRICSAYAEASRAPESGRRPRLKGFAALAPLASGAEAAKEKADEARIGESLKRLADEIGVGLPTLRDIVAEIRKPARDPREDAPPVVFRKDVKSFDDLRVGMELVGTVRNVVDFGAFVDVGVKNDGLVHISRMSDRYVRHPMDVVSVGDTVKVWIVRIDTERQKLALSMRKDKIN